MGADITLMDKSLNRLRELDNLFGGRVRCEYATGARIEACALEADLIIGAVLTVGAAAPHMLSAEQVSRLQPGAVLVDVAIDQGGCFATSRPTTHQKPTYTVNGVVHYCVANIPSAVARTATMALTHSTLPYILALAETGVSALLDDPHLMAGLNIHNGEITHQAVAESLNCKWLEPRAALQSASASV
jgi:alanine dehydrogenase